MISNIDYKGYRSTTLHLVLISYVTGTALLVFQYIDMHVWETGILGSLIAYIVRDGMSKAAEVVAMKKAEGTTTTTIQQTTVAPTLQEVKP